jgi:type II secretory pathway pseudopilin PulG
MTNTLHRLQRTRGRRGLTLLEVTFALGVFLILAGIVALSLSMSLLSGGEAWRGNVALRTMRALIGQIQAVANDGDPTQGIAAVYGTFHLNDNEISETIHDFDDDDDGIPDHVYEMADVYGQDAIGTATPDRTPCLPGPGPNGQAYISVRCYRNETTNETGTSNGIYRTSRIPDELGGPRDLNLDGDDSDMLLPSDCRIVPMILTMTWFEKSGANDSGRIVRVLTVYHIAARTAS